MTPYLQPNAQQENFNFALCRTRVVIEQTFGILKSRFQCLKGMRMRPERCAEVVLTCAILHNIATIRNEYQPVVIEDQIINQGEGNAGQDGVAVRNNLARNHFNSKLYTKISKLEYILTPQLPSSFWLYQASAYQLEALELPGSNV